MLNLNHLLTLILFLTSIIGTVFTMNAREISIEEATNLIVSQYGDSGKRIYLIEDTEYETKNDKSEYWQFFIDLKPSAGWEHDCLLVDIPKHATNSLEISNIESRRFPPDAFLKSIANTDIAKSAFYDPNSPMVEKRNLPESERAFTKRTFAVILSGGINKSSNHKRYWNDCAFIYQTLVNRFCIPKENVYPIMADGNNPELDMRDEFGNYYSSPTDLDFDGNDELKLSASSNNISMTFDEIASKITENDHLFLYVIDHGGSDDFITRSYINLWGENNKLYDYELARMLQQFSDRHININIVMGQCFSGGFIDDLSNLNCVISTACTGGELSYPMDGVTGSYDDFVYQWTCAINGKDHRGNTISSSKTHVSMKDAFEFVKGQKTGSNPQYASKPEYLGNELMFNNIPDAVNLFIKDNSEDTGSQQDNNNIFWNSSDVWLTNKKSGSTVHTAPYYTDTHKQAFINIKIHNLGIKEYEGSGKFIHVYWATAASVIPAEKWLGNIKNDKGIALGGKASSSMISSKIASGDSVVIVTAWNLPKELFSNSGSSKLNNFAFYVRITDSPYDNNPQFDYITGERGSALKNKSIITQTSLSSRKKESLILYNPYNTTKTFSFGPQSSNSNSIRITQEVILSDNLYASWRENGFKGYKISKNPDETKRAVTLLSKDSRIDGLVLNANEEGTISLDFSSITSSNNRPSKPLEFTYVQKDGDKIIGGQTYGFIPSTQSSIKLSTYKLSDNNYHIIAECDTTYAEFVWNDESGTVISTTNEAMVNPTKGNKTFFISAYDTEGNMSMNQITLNTVEGIKGISTNSNERIVIEFYDEASPLSSIVITPITNQGINPISYSIPVGTKIMDISLEKLLPGIYSISYLSENIIINSLKYKIN